MFQWNEIRHFGLISFSELIFVPNEYSNQHSKKKYTDSCIHNAKAFMKAIVHLVWPRLWRSDSLLDIFMSSNFNVDFFLEPWNESFSEHFDIAELANMKIGDAMNTFNCNRQNDRVFRFVVFAFENMNDIDIMLFAKPTSFRSH